MCTQPLGIVLMLNMFAYFAKKKKKKEKKLLKASRWRMKSYVNFNVNVNLHIIMKLVVVDWLRQRLMLVSNRVE